MLCPSCAAENPAAVEVCFACGRHLTALTHGSIVASRYEIVGLLGKGGMGVVYRAHDRLLDEVVAIKVLRHEFVGTAEMAQRFRSEIKLARKVSHPNVCRIHEYGQDGGVSYISMALIEGTDLRTLLLQHPQGLPRDQAFHVAIQAADGLQAIHDVGIIHRDLKTPNVVVEPSGVLRLMDFGIAKESGGAGGLTATGEVMGTPEYMSPEQCRGHKLEFQSDIYSLGILIYEVFTGRVPFHGDTLMATLLMQIQDPPPLDGPEAAAIPRGVAHLLRKALAKNAAQRFSTATELARALRQAQEEPAPQEVAQPKSAPPAGGDPAATRAVPPTEDRRQHTRLGISVDVVLQRLSAGGAVMQEERTVADNIGRRGARVMTSMTALVPGDLVSLREVGSSFQARAAVRHVNKPVDNIQRLGLEFLDHAAPDRLVPTDAQSAPQTQRATAARSAAHITPPSAPAAAPSPADADTGHERRRGSRLDITMNVVVKRLGRGGETLQEERSVADNVGRQGARLMTMMTGLAPGDLVFIEEVGSGFRTRAAVRSSYAGKDNIHRLGVEFLDRSAPDYLVASDDTKPRLTRPASSIEDRPSEPARPTAPPAEGPDAERLRERRREILEAYDGLKTRNHFEVLRIPRASSAAQVKEAYVQLTKQFHPDALTESGLQDLRREAGAVFHAVAAAYEVLFDPKRRPAYETFLGPSRQTPRPMSVVVTPVPGAPAAQVPEPVAEPAPEPEADLAPEPSPEPEQTLTPEDPEVEVRQADLILREARKHLADGKFWDAIHDLEGAQALAKGSRTNHAVRTLLARATAKNPKWQRRAETILLSVLNEDPAFVEAHFALGRIYREGGLTNRAEVQFRRVLDIYPSHREAAAELQSLKAARG